MIFNLNSINMSHRKYNKRMLTTTAFLIAIQYTGSVLATDKELRNTSEDRAAQGKTANAASKTLPLTLITEVLPGT